MEKNKSSMPKASGKQEKETTRMQNNKTIKSQVSKDTDSRKKEQSDKKGHK